MIQRPTMAFLMEAHSGLSAKVVAEAGFEGIWASGLSISASLGLRDNNEASWTQVLDVVEFIADAADLPILLDGDTGYGNFNSMRRLVRKLEQRGVAGVCIEDKVFPKTNSFLRGAGQPLADAQEFAGKIRAGKDAQTSDDFVIVARTEALIAGRGLKEALRRAEIYRLAGADALLIHSAKSDAEEIRQFMVEWGQRLPVVIVPTKYYRTPTEDFRSWGIAAVIWANHLMRSSLRAMQTTAAAVHADQHVRGIDQQIAPLSEVFRIQGDAELAEAEQRYLPRERGTKALVLAPAPPPANGAEQTLPPLALSATGLRLDVGSLLERAKAELTAGSVVDIEVLRARAEQAVDTSELALLRAALAEAEGDVLIAHGDAIFGASLVVRLLLHPGEIVASVETRLPYAGTLRAPFGLAVCSEQAPSEALLESVTLLDLVQDPHVDGVGGQWTGFLKLSSGGVARLLGALRALSEHELASMTVVDVLRSLLAQGQGIDVVFGVGEWLHLDAAVAQQREARTIQVAPPTQLRAGGMGGGV
jgi:phosphoenolpyruvate phosphomutase